MIFDPSMPFLRSTSILSLFEEIKAISIPEKKAEKIRENRIIITSSATGVVLTGEFFTKVSPQEKHQETHYGDQEKQPAFPEALGDSLVNTGTQA